MGRCHEVDCYSLETTLSRHRFNLKVTQLHEMLSKVFQDPNTFEELHTWLACCNPEDPHHMQRYFFCVQHPEHQGDINYPPIGGVVIEYYPLSACGLITYMYLEPEFRGTGLARCLLEIATTRLAFEMGWQDKCLDAVFMECDDPSKVKTHHPDSINAVTGLRKFQSLGMRMVDIPYIQPPLSPGKEYVDTQLLLCVPIDGRKLPSTIPAKIVFDFLHEFYNTQRVDTLGNENFMKMMIVDKSNLDLLELHSRYFDFSNEGVSNRLGIYAAPVV